MKTRHMLSAGDRVYYLYTSGNGNRVKYAAIVLHCDGDDVLIRIGRYDVDTREVRIIESTVSQSSLEPRKIPCSYEDSLAGPT